MESLTLWLVTPTRVLGLLAVLAVFALDRFSRGATAQPEPSESQATSKPASSMAAMTAEPAPPTTATVLASRSMAMSVTPSTAVTSRVIASMQCWQLMSGTLNVVGVAMKGIAFRLVGSDA